MELPCDVFARWRAYGAVRPWGEDRMDGRFALLCTSIRHDLTGQKVSIERYLPRFGPDPEPAQDLELAVAAMEAWAALPGDDE